MTPDKITSGLHHEERLSSLLTEPETMGRRPSDRALALAVFVTHGVLDTVVTFSSFVGLGYFGIETNPVMRSLLEHAFWSAHGQTLKPLWLTGAPVFAAKVAVTALAVAMLWQYRDLIPRWRAFTAALAAAGGFVVVSNVLHLIGMTAF